MVRASVHQKLANELELEAALSMTFSIDEAQDLEWEHAREFELKGEMYDVVRSKKMGDSITYVVYHDVKESALNHKINRLLANELDSNPDRKERKITIDNWSKSLYCEKMNVGFCFFGNQNNLSECLQNFRSIHLNTDSPPPDLM